jgi:MFS family permease
MAIDSYASLKIRDFRLLLVSRLFVTIALQIQAMAVGWQIYSLTHNPLSLGFVGLSEALPAIAVALYAGHVADIVERRQIALTAVGSLTVLLFLLGLSANLIASVTTLPLIIYFVIAVSGLARGFYGPALFGMLSDIVPRDLYANAAAWNSAVWQASAVVGPILGGIYYIFLGVANTYYLSTALLFIAFLCFFLIEKRPAKPSNKDASVYEKIVEGLRFVFSNQVVLGAMTLDLFAVLFGGAVALLPIFTAQVFHMGPHALGFLRAAPSVGALITATILAHRAINVNAGAVLMAAVAGFGLCMIAFGLSTNFYVALGLLALSGALDGISVYVRSTIFQLATPNEMKGRVSAVNNIFIGSSNEIGEFESGVTAKIFGLVPSVVLGGSMTLLVVLITAIKAPKLRKLHMNTLQAQTPGIPQ